MIIQFTWNSDTSTKIYYSLNKMIVFSFWTLSKCTIEEYKFVLVEKIIIDRMKLIKKQISAFNSIVEKNNFDSINKEFDLG
jgi:hypothetical protein